MRRVWWLGMMLFPIACGGGRVASGGTDETGDTGDEEVDLSPWGSGDRLRAVALETSGGARRHVGWWELELELECSFFPTEHGLRCLPVWGELAVGGGVFPRTSDRGPYLNADCTDKVEVVSEACDPDHELVAVYADGDSCEWALYEAGRLEELDVQTIYERNPLDEQCEAQLLEEGTKVVRVVPEDVTLFVEGEYQDVPVDGALGVRRLVSPDGAWSNAVLLADGQSCRPLEWEGGGRCVSRGASWYGSYNDYFGEFYSDDACTQLAEPFVRLDACTREPSDPGDVAVVYEGDPWECEFEHSTYEIGPEFTDGPIYRDILGTCYEDTTYSSNRYMLGPEVDTGGLPLLGYLEEASDTTIAWLTHDGAPLVRGGNYEFLGPDRHTCFPQRWAGGLRCVQASNVAEWGGTIRYSDDECTELVYASDTFINWPACGATDPCRP